MRTFRFGAQVKRARSRHEWAAKARQLEDLGYDALYMPDHLDASFAPLPALMAAADATTRLRIGTLVLGNDYRHPVVLAKEAATLDLLSEGRLELGLGAGWLRTDYDEAGIPCDPPGVRVERMAEAVKVIKGVLGGEPFSYSGRHYRVSEHRGSPQAVQRPHPPLLIGGGGPKVLTVAGREADIVNLNFNLRAGEISAGMAASGTAEATATKLDWLRQAAGERFADLELSVTAHVVSVTDDRAGLVAAAAGAFGLSTEDALEVPHVLVGTVSQIVEDLQRRREQFGFSHIVVARGAEEAMAPVVAELAGR